MKRVVSLAVMSLLLLCCSQLFASGTIQWKFPLAAYSCYEPAIGSDGTIYVPSGNTLIAIDSSVITVDANKVVTNTQEATKWSYSSGDYVNTPTIDKDGNIYVQFQPNGVMRLNSSGQTVWENAYNPNSPNIWPGGDCASRIAIGLDGDVYVSEGGGVLHAIYASNGLQKWTSTSGGSTSAVGKTGVLYSNGSSQIFAINSANGAATALGLLPSYPRCPSIGSEGDNYIVGNYYLHKISASGSAWDPQFYHTGQGVGQASIASDGTIYFVSRVYKLYAVNPDGTEKWNYSSSLWLTGTPAVGNDGMIYVAAESGFLAVTNQGSLDWQMNYGDGYFASNSGSSPIIGPDGTIYVIGIQNGDNNKYLYAISSSSTSPAMSPWPMVGANAQHTYQVEVRNLTVSVEPTGAGTVSVSPSGEWFVKGREVTLTANANTGYSFAYWDDGTSNYTQNPLTITMDGAKTVTGKFFKTFRASAGNFKADINDDGGQCVPYVRYETDILWDDFNGDANSTYQQAITAGYATSATVPRISSVIVFAVQSGMPYGHVGIVTAIDGNNITIRDSNWNLDEKVKQHTENISNYDILGYIYYTP